jgi:hypothetical protein
MQDAGCGLMSIPVMVSVIAGYAEARETSTLLMAVRAFLEAFQ